MKIKKSELKQIIKEELETVLDEKKKKNFKIIWTLCTFYIITLSILKISYKKNYQS